MTGRRRATSASERQALVDESHLKFPANSVDQIRSSILICRDNPDPARLVEPVDGTAHAVYLIVQFASDLRNAHSLTRSRGPHQVCRERGCRGHRVRVPREVGQLSARWQAPGHDVFCMSSRPRAETAGRTRPDGSAIDDTVRGAETNYADAAAAFSFRFRLPVAPASPRGARSFLSRFWSLSFGVSTRSTSSRNTMGAASPGRGPALMIRV